MRSNLIGWSVALLVLGACDGQSPAHGESCQAIIDVCHDVDPGSGPIHDCHETAHELNEAACEPIEEECVALCVAAAGDAGARDGGSHHGDGGVSEVCRAISSACHAVDPGSGPIHECHDVGHAGDDATCREREAECLALCAAVDGGTHDGGH